MLKLMLLAVFTICVIQSTKAAPEWNDESFLKYLLEKVEAVRIKCEEESGATDGDLDAIEAGKIPDTRTGKCMIACEFMEYGIINENKTYNKNGIFEMLPKFLRNDKSLDGFKNLTERCEQAVTKVENGDECELAAKLKLCFHQHAPEYGMKSFIGFDALEYIDQY